MVLVWLKGLAMILSYSKDVNNAIACERSTEPYYFEFGILSKFTLNSQVIRHKIMQSVIAARFSWSLRELSNLVFIFLEDTPVPYWLRTHTICII
jgi:hypothetical protein